MSIELTLEKGADSATIPADDIISVSRVDLEHTALSKWEVEIIPTDSYDDFQLGTGTLSVDGTPIIRGELQQVSKSRERTTLAGAGPAEALRENTAIRTYSSTAVYKAIESYAQTTPAVEWNVIEPYVRVQQEDSRFVDAPNIDLFDTITNIPDDAPLEIDALNYIRLAQTCWFTEAENAQVAGGNMVDSNQTGENYSNFEAVELTSSGDQISVSFTPSYRVPEGQFGAIFRTALNSFNGEIAIQIDGFQETGITYNGASSDVGWDTGTGFNTQELSANTEHTVTFEAASVSNGSVVVDAVAPRDSGERFGGFGYTFTDTVDTQFYTLNGPELYPDEFAFDIELNSFWHVNQSETEININDTSNNQAIRQSPNGGDFYATENNTNFATADFDAENVYGANARVQLVLSRYSGANATQTPTNGDAGQEITNITIDLWTDDLPIIDELTLDGDTWFANMQRLHEKGDMRFVVDHRNTDLVVESFRTADPKVVKPDNWIISDPESVNYTRNTEDYWNQAISYPAPGSGITEQILNESTEQARTGVTKPKSQVTSISNLDDLILETRSFLREGLNGDEFDGSIEIATTYVAPGYPYEPGAFEDQLANLETVSLGYDVENNTSTLNFGSRRSLVASLQGVKNE